MQQITAGVERPEGCHAPLDPHPVGTRFGERNASGHCACRCRHRNIRTHDVRRADSSVDRVSRFPDVSCGSGQVVPLGQATEVMVFGAGCGGTCDRRTINLARGSLILDETVTDSTCPQVCRPGPLEVGTASLSDVVIGGTGTYEGATGTVRAAISNARPAGSAVAELSGVISFRGLRLHSTQHLHARCDSRFTGRRHQPGGNLLKDGYHETVDRSSAKSGNRAGADRRETQP
jgi:hypothetical protein